MGVSLRKLDAGAVNAVKLVDAIRQGKYVFERMDHQPQSVLASNVATAGYADPTAAGPNRLLFRNGLTATYTQRATQIILAPIYDPALGLDVTQDQTDNDGVEWIFGSLGVKSGHVYTVGTDNAFIRVKFTIVDVSGTDDLLIGFRKNEAIQANVDDYADMAAFNVELGDIKVETILGGAATVTTDTTQNWLDGETHTLQVNLVGRGVGYLVDGAPITVAPTTPFQFADASVLVPFFFFLQATTSPGKVYFQEVEVGPLSAINANGVNS